MTRRRKRLEKLKEGVYACVCGTECVYTLCVKGVGKGRG